MTPLTTRRQTVNPEFWAIIGVGIALAGLQWRLYATLTTRMDRMETRIDARLDTLQRNVDERLNNLGRRLARIEGWIAGRFVEEPVPTA